MKIIDQVVKPKRKRYNKNKKKAWRKKIDITDIEEAIEDKRREERLGGPLEEKVSEELFTLDFGANDKKEETKSWQTAVLKPNHKQSQPLKCHQFINGLPGAKAISQKKGVMKQRENRMIKTARKVSGNTFKADLQRKALFEQRKKALKQKRKIQRTDEFKEDIWNNNENELDVFGEVGKTYMKEPMDFYKEQTRKNAVRTPAARFEKPSSLPAIIPPQTGASYNPSFEGHQKLLAEAMEFEMRKQNVEEKVKRLIKKYLPSSSDGISYSEMMAEMAEGLPIPINQWSIENAVVDIKQEPEDADICGGQSRQEKKSKQSRKKAKTLKIKEQKRLKNKEVKRMESDVFKVKSYEKEIKKKEQKLKTLQKKKEKQQKQKKFQPKKLSKYRFEEDDVMVPLGNELSDSLRTVKPMGNALDNTYKNFQRRNLIETRVRVKKEKAKTKKVFKRNHKDDMQKFIKSLKV